MTEDLKLREIEDRVALGAAWLDEYREGWFNEVDLGQLILSSPCRCVLGQLYGEYMDAPLVDIGGDVAGADYGFNAYGHSPERDAEYVHLEDEWRRVITERRAAA
jgi:hypothetical protein